MGGTGSKEVTFTHFFKPNITRPGQGEDAVRHFRAMKLSEVTVNRLYSVFVDIDRDGTGALDLLEFNRYIGVEETEFTDRVFHLFDANGDGIIDFTEFVDAVWTYCMLDAKALVTFAFKLYEEVTQGPSGPSGAGYLTIEEVRLMLEEVYGQLIELNTRLKPLFEELDANQDQRLSLVEFKAMHDKYASLLFPAFRMQLAMRSAVLGEAFWAEQMAIRAREGQVANESLWEIMREVDAQRRKSDRGVMAEMGRGRWVPTDLPKGTYVPAPSLSYKARGNAALAQRELLVRAGIIKVRRSSALAERLAAKAGGAAAAAPSSDTGAASDPAARRRAQRKAQRASKAADKAAGRAPVRGALDAELARAMNRVKRR